LHLHNRLWGPFKCLFKDYRWHFQEVKTARACKSSKNSLTHENVSYYLKLMARCIHGPVVSVSSFNCSSKMTPRPLLLESQMAPVHPSVIIDGYAAFGGTIIC
jgi:hypothetical protein